MSHGLFGMRNQGIHTRMRKAVARLIDGAQHQQQCTPRAVWMCWAFVP